VPFINADIWNIGYIVLMDESIKRIFYEIREYIRKTLFYEVANKTLSERAERHNKTIDINGGSGCQLK
jgi:hypothetical protein